jgi:hypothetical protein
MTVAQMRRDMSAAEFSAWAAYSRERNAYEQEEQERAMNKSKAGRR